MFLEQEIEKVIRDNYRGQNLERDVKFILEYFGFGDEIYPTEKFLSKKHKVGETRGGGSYIVTTKFNKNAIENSDLLLVLREIEKSLYGQRYCFYSDFLSLLQDGNLIDQTVQLPGLFTLLKHFNLARNYDIYDLKINKVERGDFKFNKEYLIINKSVRSQIKEDIKQTFKQLGRSSIRYLGDVYNKKHRFYLSADTLKRIISATEDSWCLDVDNEFWFLLETRENRVLNHLKKVYKINQSFERDALADAMAKSLREYAVTKPTSGIVKKYLDSCRHVSVSGKYYILNDNLQDSDVVIEKIELAIINYLKENGASTRNLILKYLFHMGFSIRSTIDSYLEYSPLFLKRRLSGDRLESGTIYEIVFIGDYRNFDTAFHEDRYSSLKKLLQRLDNTDGKAEQKVRKEQSYLRTWLFEGKSSEKCALCGKEYTIESLVAAHKKPRKFCSPNERTDPCIVMPACKFGCDQVYEKRWVKIANGIIEVNDQKTASITKSEKGYIEKIRGRTIDEIWIMGEKSYFDDLCVDVVQ